MEPDNAERFQPDLSLIPAFQPEPVAKPSLAWTTPLPSSPNSSTPSMEAELAEQLVQLDEIAALIAEDESDNEELENEELRRRRNQEEEEDNGERGKGHGVGKGKWRRKD